MSMPDAMRAMWLLNHGTLRAFEVPQLKEAGFGEVFLPKSFPYDEGNLSASVTYSEDANLTIPADELDVLNSADWYGNAGPEAWAIANRRFRLLFLAFFPAQLEDALRNFQGTIVLRVFGLSEGTTYTRLIYDHLGPAAVERIRRLRDRFWFGTGYEHLHVGEANFLASRACFLPVGLADRSAQTPSWTGEDRRILFICPRIATSPYYEKVYTDFKETFGDLPHVIGGAQPLPIADPHVSGYIPADAYNRMMYGSRVMYYHSREPNQLHYHPIEAMRASMPVIFLKGGLLDRLAGSSVSGRARDVAEARKMVTRIMDGDVAFIEKIRQSQRRLPEQFSSAVMSPAWQRGIAPVIASARRSPTVPVARKKRVGVILPIEYRGGALRAAKNVAHALLIGSREDGVKLDVVLAHRGEEGFYRETDFTDLDPRVQRRPFVWMELSGSRAESVMSLRGHPDWKSSSDKYCIPEDGANNLIDCDAWVVISDRLLSPLLPLRPHVMIVYDYLQRYYKVTDPATAGMFIEANLRADKIVTTTEFTRRDALEFIGAPEKKVICLPMISALIGSARNTSPGKKNYFIWTTNLAPHKNHANAAEALSLYYERFGGKLRCVVTGVNSRKLAERFEEDPSLDQVEFVGEVSEARYRRLLEESAFLWHPALLDNGTFSVIEAASAGVPSLSSDYPAMREIARQASLDLAYFDPHDPLAMAEALSEFEGRYEEYGRRLPTREALTKSIGVESHATQYWKVVKEWL